MNKTIRNLILCAGVAALLTLFSEDAEAQRFRQKKRKVVSKAETRSLHSYNYGLGVAMGAGTYSGITGALMWDRHSYLQAQMGIQILNATFGSSADYVMEFPELISKTTVPYAGGGIIFVYGADYASLISDADGNFHFGLRAPLGIYTLLDEFPIQLFGEVIPGFLLVAETTPVFGANLGFRWFFK